MQWLTSQQPFQAFLKDFLLLARTFDRPKQMYQAYAIAWLMNPLKLLTFLLLFHNISKTFQDIVRKSMKC